MTQRRHASLAIHESGVHGVHRVRTWHKLRDGGVVVLAVLLPGAYVQVAMPLTQSGVLAVPVNTLLLRGEGPRVAVVDDKGVVTLKGVELGKDFGAKTEVLSRISVADRLVLNPPDGLADGDRLQVVEKKSKQEGK